MIEWWGFVIFCSYLGAIFGGYFASGDVVGFVYGLLIGFCVGTIPPVGPTIDFDPLTL